jgi:hypothetical protein
MQHHGALLPRAQALLAWLRGVAAVIRAALHAALPRVGGNGTTAGAA